MNADTQTGGQRDSPWHCPQSTVPGNNSSLYGTLAHTQQKRSRLRASIPDTFPLFPPSFLHILHPPSQFPCPPTLLPPSLPPSITSCLCFGSRRGKSQGCSSREQCCHGVGVRKRKKRKLGHCPGRIKQGLLCAAPEWSEAGERDRKTGGQVDGIVVCSSVRCPLLLISGLSRKPEGLSLCSTAGFDYIDNWQEIT